MGFSVNRLKRRPSAQINITPLVDVVLVLLIIMMLAMPIEIRKIEIEVPRELLKTEVSTKMAVRVTGKADGSLIVNDGTGDRQITRTKLRATMRAALQAADAEVTVFVDFEDSVSYADAVSAIDTIRGAAPTKQAGDNTIPNVRLAMTIREPDRRN